MQKIPNDIIDRINSLKLEINQLRPLDNDFLIELKDYFKIGLTYSSNSIEGNTISISETKVIIEDGITIGGKPVRDHLEVLGHAEAFDYLYSVFKTGEITEEIVKKLHSLFYKKIDDNNSGKYRQKNVLITGSSNPLPNFKSVPKLMGDFVKKLDQFKDSHPVELAAFAHKEFILIHPFVDGNGRVARLITNFILLHYGFPIITIAPILRAKYFNSLEKAGNGKDMDFFIFIANQVIESLIDYKRMFVK